MTFGTSRKTYRSTISNLPWTLVNKCNTSCLSFLSNDFDCWQMIYAPDILIQTDARTNTILLNVTASLYKLLTDVIIFHRSLFMQHWIKIKGLNVKGFIWVCVGGGGGINKNNSFSLSALEYTYNLFSHFQTFFPQKITQSIAIRTWRPTSQRQADKNRFPFSLLSHTCQLVSNIQPTVINHVYRLTLLPPML